MSYTCQVCLDLLQTSGYSPPARGRSPKHEEKLTFGHHYSLESLEKAVNEGCYICEKLWQGQTESDQQAIRDWCRSFVEVEDMGGEPLGGQALTRFTIYWNLGRVERFLAEFRRGRTAYCCFRPMQAPEMPLKSDTTSSSESLQIARQWIQNCLQHHKECNSDSTAGHWYPTRLLYINKCEDAEPVIRLVHTAEEPPVGPYMTLSHCWGNAKILTLTRDNLSEFSERIVFSDLPKTFRDAVIVAHSLGIRYLWIDSLCIIQNKDDLSDWSHEAGLMQRVYSLSHCNIFASVSSNSFQGLFRTRDPRSLYGPKVTLHTRGLEHDPALTESQIVDASSWEMNVAFGALNLRGWVFQERLLAPRVLHFGHEQLLWECREHQACESFPEQLPPVNGYPPTLDYGFKNSLYPTVARMERSFRQDKNGIGEYWSDVVTAYSEKSLTEPGDKLVALSGIVKLIAALEKGPYHAGLWRTDMEFQLLWTSRHQHPNDGSVKQRPLVYQAPTWSWACIDGGVHMPHAGIEEHALFNVVDVVLQHVTEDVTGQVTGGHLDLRGHLLPMSLSVNEHVKLGRPWYSKVVDICTGRQNTLKSNRFYMQLDGRDSSNNLSEILNDNLEGRLFYMPATASGENGFYIRLILLLRIVDSKRALFERTGIGMVYMLEELELRTLLCSLNEQEKRDLPCLRYENGLHTIRII